MVGYWMRKVVLLLYGAGRCVENSIVVIKCYLEKAQSNLRTPGGWGGGEMGLEFEGRVRAGPDINVINMLISSLFLAPSIIYIYITLRIDCTRGEQYSGQIIIIISIVIYLRISSYSAR